MLQIDSNEHSVSLSTDTPLANHFFCTPQVLKNLTSPKKQTKSPRNPNMLRMFNNNTHTDQNNLQTRNSYLNYSSDLTESKYHRTKY